MILKNFKEPVKLEDSKIAILKQKFPYFFKGEGAGAVVITLKDTAFYKVKRTNSLSTSIDISEFEDRKQSPMPVQYLMTFSVPDKDGSMATYSYSVNPPIVKDALGMNFEYDASSGNMQLIGHNTAIESTRLEYLYFLYFYSDIFDNGARPNPMSSLTFFNQSEAKAIEVSKIKREASNAVLLNDMTDEKIANILKGMFKAVTDDAGTNYTTLFNVLNNASEEEKETFNQLASSGKAKKSVIVDDETNIPSLVTDLMEADNIRCVTEKSEDFPKPAWYWKGDKDSEEAGKWLKTPFSQIKAASEDHRFDLVETLQLNETLLNKLRGRY